MCKICEIKPVYEFTNKRKICKNCFIRYFQKKFLYIIRKFEMINRGDTVGYNNECGFRDVVLEDLLKMFSEKGIVEIVKLLKSEVGSRKSDFKFAISSTIDFEADKIVHILVKGDVKNLKEIAPTNKKIIKPLYLFLDKEVLLYAKIKKLKFKKEKKSGDELSMFVESLEKKHPEIKRAILNSYLELYKF